MTDFLSYINALVLSPSEPMEGRLQSLGEACLRGNLAGVAKQVKDGVNIDEINQNGESALFLAAVGGHVKIVNFLLTRGADANQTEKHWDCTALHVACYLNNHEMAKILIDYKADINLRMASDETSLYVSCQQNDIKMVDIQLEAGADVNTSDSIKWLTPLHVSCQRNNIVMVRNLLKNKAHLGLQDIHDRTPLYTACSLNNPDLVCLLIDAKADVNGYGVPTEWYIQDDEDDFCVNYPIHVAVENNFDDIVNILLHHPQIDVNCLDNKSQLNPVQAAAKAGNLEVMNSILTHADIDRNSIFSSFHIGAFYGHLTIVRYFVEGMNQRDANILDDDGYTVIEKACDGGSLDVVQYLCQNTIILFTFRLALIAQKYAYILEIILAALYQTLQSRTPYQAKPISPNTMVGEQSPSSPDTLIELLTKEFQNQSTSGSSSGDSDDTSSSSDE